ncbi:ComEA family DNA-binding protein [Blastococcus sp. TF02A-35]|uniref:helix-hairpin-helix domain-containing protein n=1 Tax=Blastococcus sp. TF02A-35 TaxID=2559612 RepID=UPI001073869F|nr:ComEA family DNA-binding protein [Blastococcus sp. TF02A_35]TFV47837.1 competence protein ComEA [Blastococcus sp. TF02A_35]
MRLPLRRTDDADLIRARLRALLAQEPGPPGGWVPEEDDGEARTVPVEVPAEALGGMPAGIGRHRAPGTAARVDTGRPGARALLLAAVLAVALLLGWTWLDRPAVEPAGPADRPSAAPVPPSTPVGEMAESSATVVVSVVGQVARPGLVTLPTGARVADALAAAGGPLPGADAASVNLAAPVADGEQIAVGLPGGAGPAAAQQGPAPPRAGGLLDLNTAGAAELDGLPGIGPVLAQRIVDHRTRNGPFGSVEELDDVPGIGPSTAAEIAGLVTV